MPGYVNSGLNTVAASKNSDVGVNLPCRVVNSYRVRAKMSVLMLNISAFGPDPTPVTVRTNYKSPYACLAKEPTYAPGPLYGRDG